MATNYTLHKRLGDLYRASGFMGPYSAWLRSIGYVKGCHGAEVALAAALAEAEAKKREGAEAKAPASGGSCGAGGAAPTS